MKIVESNDEKRMTCLLVESNTWSNQRRVRRQNKERDEGASSSYATSNADCEPEAKRLKTNGSDQVLPRLLAESFRLRAGLNLDDSGSVMVELSCDNKQAHESLNQIAQFLRNRLKAQPSIT